LGYPKSSLLPEPQETTAEVERLREINERLVMLTAHELRTPLTHILAYLRLRQESAPMSERCELDVVVEQALALKERLDQVLLLDQLEAGLYELHCAPLSIQETIGRAIETQRCHIEEKKLTLDMQVECSAIVWGDRELLTRALDHLIANACKFSLPRGIVEVRVDCAETLCCVRVSDHGIGIATEKQSQIFEPFFQVEMTRSRRYNGLGIGLHLVRAIAEKHGGSVQVQSKVGYGSTFTMMIPLP